ncbi:hypothetical protein [Pseudofrankia sp. BMG5.36]|uniref:hypothetical protein n=1 Tax=Pseudofrankia sp. BMG5.36 TaxID=1834512 RepID=UPI0010425EB4|nr:hypothetical protein [Pseudofrankia sp. BMG5.36]
MAAGHTVTLALRFPGLADLPPNLGVTSEELGVTHYYSAGELADPTLGIERIMLLRIPEVLEILAFIVFSDNAFPQDDRVEPIYNARAAVQKLIADGTLPSVTKIIDIPSVRWKGDSDPDVGGDNLFWTRKGKFPPVLWWDAFRYMIGRPPSGATEWTGITKILTLPRNRILWRQATEVHGLRLEYSDAHVILRANNGDKVFSHTDPPSEWVRDLRRHSECLVVTGRSTRPREPVSQWLRKGAQEERVVGGLVRAVPYAVPPDVGDIEGCTFIPSKNYRPSLRRQIYLDSNVLIDGENWFYQDNLPLKSSVRLKNTLLSIAGDDIIPGVAIEETCRSRLAESPDTERVHRAGHAWRVISYWPPEQIEAEFAEHQPAATRYPLGAYESPRDWSGGTRSDLSLFTLMQAPGYAILLKLRILLASKFSGPQDRLARFRKLVRWIDTDLMVGSPLEFKVALNAFFGCSGEHDYVQRLLKIGTSDAVHATWTAMWDLTFLRFLDYGASIDELNFNPCLITRDRALLPLRQTCEPVTRPDSVSGPIAPYMLKLDISPRWKSIEPQIMEILEEHASNQRDRVTSRRQSVGDHDPTIRGRRLALQLESELEGL